MPQSDGVLIFYYLYYSAFVFFMYMTLKDTHLYKNTTQGDSDKQKSS